VGWTTFAFGGVYAWTLPVAAALCCWIVAAARASREADPDVIRIDWVLALIVVAIVLQLLPLPASLVDLLSPASRRIQERIDLVAPLPSTLTIDRRSTAWAALVVLLGVTPFCAGHRRLGDSAARALIRGVSVIAVVLSAVGIAQASSATGLMYWMRAPLQEGAPPFGPFVDRNSFATWVLLAAPLCAGYLAAHTAAHRHEYSDGTRWTARLRDALDARAIWLTAALALMVAALTATVSRSGISGLAVAIAGAAYLRSLRRPRERARAHVVAAIAGVIFVLAIARIDPLAVGERFAQTRASAATRLVIWRDTVPILRDFWLTGTGAGTYETAMLVYQRSSPGVRFNQAHNQYLQWASEGGLLVIAPAGVVLWLFVRAAARSLAADHSVMFWVRGGALCGLAAVAAQSVWETGLTVPANAVLAGLSAAIALHHRRTSAEAPR
jgi:O-antigen ligase